MPLDGRKTGSRVPEATKLAAVAYYRTHGSLKLTAEKYGMSIGTLATALKNHNVLGEVSCPSTRPRKGRSSRVDSQGIDLIRSLLEDNPNMYLKDIKAKLKEELKINVDTSNICRQMKKARISRKALATQDPVQREAIEREEEEQMRQQALLRAQAELERRYEARRQRLALQRTPEEAQAAHDAAVAAARERAEQEKQLQKQQHGEQQLGNAPASRVLASLNVQHEQDGEQAEQDQPMLATDVDSETLESLALGALHASSHHPHLNLPHALTLEGRVAQDEEERARANALLQSSYDTAIAQFQQEPLGRRPSQGRRKRQTTSNYQNAMSHIHHDLIGDEEALTMQEHLGDAYYGGNAHSFDASFDAATITQLHGDAEDDHDDDEADEVSQYTGLQMEDGTIAIDPNMDSIDA
jgi:transposase